MTKSNKKLKIPSRVRVTTNTPHPQLKKETTNRPRKAGINSNWIDQILGHQLINSRDAYSLPTDEELKEAYTKTYQYIKVYPETNSAQERILELKTSESSK